MVGNADATTEIADTASSHAREVADNMHSVSAAMEQSTTNLDMIASASEEMGNTIREIAENSARARITTEEAVTKAQKSHGGVQELGKTAGAIDEVQSRFESSKVELEIASKYPCITATFSAG